MTDPSVLNATGLARTEALKVRLSREEEAEIRRRATALGVSAAAYARSAALGRRTAVRGRASIAGMEELLKAAGRLGQDLRDAPAGVREQVYRQVLEAVLRLHVQAEEPPAWAG